MSQESRRYAERAEVLVAIAETHLKAAVQESKKSGDALMTKRIETLHAETVTVRESLERQLDPQQIG